MKLSLLIEVDSLTELDRVAKRLIPIEVQGPQTLEVQVDMAAIERRVIEQAEDAADVEAAREALAEQGPRETFDQVVGRATSEPVVVTAAQMEEAVKAYGRTKGFAAARALLGEYGVERVSQVPSGKAGELYARLTA